MNKLKYRLNPTISVVNKEDTGVKTTNPDSANTASTWVQELLDAMNAQKKGDEEKAASYLKPGI